MESLRNIYVIARRELRAYFDSLVAYVVIGVSMLGLGVYFFLYQGGFWQVDRATMARLFDIMPAFLCLVIPLVTMSSLAEEKRSGTIEMLITMPVKDSEVILGKYFAALGMCTILLAATASYPIAMFGWPWHLGVLDAGPVWTGYLGLFLLCGAGVAVGMLFSSVTESQVIAFFLTAGTMLLLYAMGFVVEQVKGGLGEALAFVSFQSRFLPFARGLIDTRAVVYFLSIAILCLLVSFRSLESRKWS
jgi:ABC-2 type transport system permease protein